MNSCKHLNQKILNAFRKEELVKCAKILMDFIVWSVRHACFSTLEEADSVNCLLPGRLG